jgi:hypothetical protein
MRTRGALGEGSGAARRDRGSRDRSGQRTTNLVRVREREDLSNPLPLADTASGQADKGVRPLARERMFPLRGHAVRTADRWSAAAKDPLAFATQPRVGAAAPGRDPAHARPRTDSPLASCRVHDHDGEKLTELASGRDAGDGGRRPGQRDALVYSRRLPGAAFVKLEADGGDAAAISTALLRVARPPQVQCRRRSRPGGKLSSVDPGPAIAAPALSAHQTPGILVADLSVGRYSRAVRDREGTRHHPSRISGAFTYAVDDCRTGARSRYVSYVAHSFATEPPGGSPRRPDRPGTLRTQDMRTTTVRCSIAARCRAESAGSDASDERR